MLQVHNEPLVLVTALPLHHKMADYTGRLTPQDDYQCTALEHAELRLACIFFLLLSLFLSQTCKHAWPNTQLSKSSDWFFCSEKLSDEDDQSVTGNVEGWLCQLSFQQLVKEGA